jgi:hypothetical protein
MDPFSKYGSAEGRITCEKESHVRCGFIVSSWPTWVVSAPPGEVTVGNIMFVELKNNVKKPMMIHVDICTKLITGLSLKSKSKEECTKAILDIKEDYLMKGRHMKQLVFD